MICIEMPLKDRPGGKLVGEENRIECLVCPDLLKQCGSYILLRPGQRFVRLIGCYLNH